MDITYSERDDVYSFVKNSKNIVLIPLKLGSKSKSNQLNGTNLLSVAPIDFNLNTHAGKLKMSILLKRFLPWL